MDLHAAPGTWTIWGYVLERDQTDVKGVDMALTGPAVGPLTLAVSTVLREPLWRVL